MLDPTNNVSEMKFLWGSVCCLGRRWLFCPLCLLTEPDRLMKKTYHLLILLYNDFESKMEFGSSMTIIFYLNYLQLSYVGYINPSLTKDTSLQ